MSLSVTVLVSVGIVAFLILICVELMGGASSWETGFEFAATVLFVLLLRWLFGYPFVRQPFSPEVSYAQIGMLFVAIILGMIGDYFFNGKAGFSWPSLLKPIIVSPLVLLPLLGTLSPEANHQQFVCVMIVGFQSGFFWRKIVRNAKTKNG